MQQIISRAVISTEIIDDFESLQYEFNLSLGNSDLINNSNIDSTIIINNEKKYNTMDVPIQTKRISPDSLLFTIAEKLLFDFGKIELALENFENLINDYDDSKYRMQSMYILNYYLPESKWKDKLYLEFPHFMKDLVCLQSQARSERCHEE